MFPFGHRRGEAMLAGGLASQRAGSVGLSSYVDRVYSHRADKASPRCARHKLVCSIFGSPHICAGSRGEGRVCEREWAEGVLQAFAHTPSGTRITRARIPTYSMGKGICRTILRVP